MGDKMKSINAIQQAAEWIRSQPLPFLPEVGLILGSGLGVLADRLERHIRLHYADIPDFPVSTVAGHAGELLIGELGGKKVVMMKGRFHLYEGYTGAQVTFPVRVMRELGVRQLIVTNAAGGINPDYAVGDLMLIRDHLDFTFRNPLIGPNDDRVGVRFPDMSEAYSRRLRALARNAAEAGGIDLRDGVYAAMTGPSYETPAEIRMLRLLGADAVGMSTVPEVIAARHAGMEVLGLSCISNMASGMLQQPLSHEEVMETTERVKETFVTLVTSVVQRLDEL